jgi:hypothetical protein
VGGKQGMVSVYHLKPHPGQTLASIGDATGPQMTTLQRQNAENFKQIFPEQEYRGLSPSFHIHVSVSELYISTMGLPFLLEEICRLILGII